MSGLVEIAGAVLAQAFQRAEVSAQNLANMTTPGYKAIRYDSDSGSAFGSFAAAPARSQQSSNSVDLSPGKYQTTGSPFDLAISGEGYFVVRSDQQTYYTRDGQFARGADGKLLTADGFALQAVSGGDVTVSQDAPQILPDGTVLENAQPVARIAVVDFEDAASLRPVSGGLFSAPADGASDAGAQIHQGMLEASNVSTADEMISIMTALRSAESGQKIAQVYDDLLAQTITVFGQT